jgi:hypothetical protein
LDVTRYLSINIRLRAIPAKNLKLLNGPESSFQEKYKGTTTLHPSFLKNIPYLNELAL